MKKTIIYIIVLFLILLVIKTIYTNIIFKENMPVLAYHDVVKNPINETDMNIKQFEKQMKYLYNHNYKTLSIDEFYKFKKGKKISGKKVLLTFDDGDESFYKNVVPILKKYNFKATIFVIQSAVDNKGYLTKDQLKELKNNKYIDVESHSYSIHNGDAANSKDYNIYNNDMKINKNNKYKYYAYPFGIQNNNYIKALKNNNYKLAFLYSPTKWTNINQDDYKITRVPIYKSNSLIKFIIKVSFKI